MYFQNQLTIIPKDSLETNELFQHVIKYKIDLIISIECKCQNFQQYASSSFEETVLDNFNIKELNRKYACFKYKVI